MPSVAIDNFDLKIQQVAIIAEQQKNEVTIVCKSVEVNLNNPRKKLVLFFSWKMGAVFHELSSN